MKRPAFACALLLLLPAASAAQDVQECARKVMAELQPEFARVGASAQKAMALQERVRKELEKRCGIAMGPAPANPQVPAAQPNVVTSKKIVDVVAQAQRARKGGDAGANELRNAISAAGFGIRGANGEWLLQPQSPQQGIAFDSWEVTGMAGLLERGAGYPLVDVAHAINKVLSLPPTTQTAQLLLDGIREQAKSDKPTTRFAAQFIAELGRQGPFAYDLLAAATKPEAVILDAVQLSFVLRRLSGDLAARGRTGASGFLVDPAAIRARGPRVIEEAKVIAACALNETESLITDWASLGIMTGQSKIMGLLEGTPVEAAGKHLSLANNILSYLKLMLSFLLIDVEFDLSGGSPLVRTKSDLLNAHGEQRTVSTTLRMRTKDLEWFNCARLALNHAGLDFSVAANGPLPGVEVAWRPQKGFVEGLSGNTGILQFAAGYAERWKNDKTDATGRASVVIEGKRQKRKVPDKAQPVLKDASLGLDVKLKPNDLYREIKSPDMLSSITGGVLAFLPELVYRTRIPISSFAFQVKDWVRGYEFHAAWRDQSQTPEALVLIDYDLTAYVCGDPLQNVWTTSGKVTMTGTAGGKTTTKTSPISGKDRLSGLNGEIYDPGLTARIDASDPARVLITMHYENHDPPSRHITKPLQELSDTDTRCSGN